MKRGTVFLLVLLVLAGGVITVGAVIKFEGMPPVVQFSPGKPQVLGVENSFRLAVTDQGQGLRSLSVILKQGEKEHQLAERTWPARYIAAGSDVSAVDLELKVAVKELGIKDGPAVLSLTVRDHSWRESFHGNKYELTQSLVVDTQPPVITLSSRQNYLNLGGCGLVVYKSNENIQSGVSVAETVYPGLPLEESPHLYHALFAIPYNLPHKAELIIGAKDRADNTTRIRIPAQIKPRRWRQSKMNISDSFLEAKIPELRKAYPDLPQDNLEAYLVINRKIRAENNAAIKKVTSQASPVRMWSGPFIQLRNSKRTAGFADHRTYIYHGKEVDRQVHMGMDLASLAQAEVPAANRGRVAMASYLGIYGNCIILDHGQGLFTLYAHLTSMSVSPDQEVDKGHIIGATGTTGLAGGDHLHYAVICNGTFVNPVEWYDPRWIRNNVTAKEESAVEGG